MKESRRTEQEVAKSKECSFMRDPQIEGAEAATAGTVRRMRPLSYTRLGAHGEPTSVRTEY